MMFNETDNSSNLDNIYIGIFYSLFVTFIFLAYLLVLKVINSDQSLKKQPCYRIMFHLGIVDIGQLIAHFIAGPFSICQCSNFYPLFNKTLGAFLNGLSLTAILVMLLLACNRYFTSCKPHMAEALFTDKGTTICLVVCWLYSFAVIATYLSPWVSVIYYPAIYTWSYDDSAYSHVVQSIEFATVTLQLTVILLFYVAVVCSFKELMELSHEQSSEAHISLIVQAALIYLVTMVTVVYWHTITLWEWPNSKWPFVLGNTLWITFNGVNPFIYLTLNKTIRTKTRQLLSGGNVVVTPVIQLQMNALKGMDRKNH